MKSRSWHEVVGELVGGPVGILGVDEVVAAERGQIGVAGYLSDTTGEQLVNDLMALGFYNSDPGESAYYDTVKRVMDYQEKQGKERPTIIPTDKANALYY